MGEIFPLVGILPAFDLFFVLSSILVFLYCVIRKLPLTLPTIFLSIVTIIWMNRNGAVSFYSDSKAIDKVKVLSLNVGQFGKDASDLNAVINMIDFRQPEIIALQEFGLYHKWPDTESMARDFKEEIGFAYYHFHPHKDNIFGTAIFSKYPIITSEMIFNETSQTNEGWKHRIVRNTDTIEIINMHLESFNLNNQNRLSLNEVLLKQERQIHSLLKAHNPNFKTVVCGDFNMVAGSKVYNTVHKKFDDAILEAGLAWLPTLKTYPIRIDHVFHNQLTTIIDARMDWKTPSDHAAILFRVN